MATVITDFKVGLHCTKPWTSFQVHDHKGNVNPCCWSRSFCGNLNENSIDQIWNGEKFIYMRENMAKGNIAAICKSNCPHLTGEFIEEWVEPTSQECRANLLLQFQEIRERRLVLRSKPSRMRIVPSLDCNLSWRDVLSKTVQTQLDYHSYPAHLRNLLPDITGAPCHWRRTTV